MPTHTCIEANIKADTKRVVGERISEMHSESTSATQVPSTEEVLFQTEPPIAPVAVIPQTLTGASGKRNLRRVITREEGRALEMIGHATDYLNDCYLYEGDDQEIINIGGSTMKALGILAAMRIQILQSLPLQESRTTRLWNALFHRNSVHTEADDSEYMVKREQEPSFHSSHHGLNQDSRPIGVLPLSSSR